MFAVDHFLLLGRTTFVTSTNAQWNINRDNFLNWILNCKTIFINCVHNGSAARQFVRRCKFVCSPAVKPLAQLVVFPFGICQIDFFYVFTRWNWFSGPETIFLQKEKPLWCFFYNLYQARKRLWSICQCLSLGSEPVNLKERTPNNAACLTNVHQRSLLCGF